VDGFMKNPVKKGFTIIELAIVISILGLLAVVVVPQINATKFEAKNRVVYDNVDIVRDYVAKVLKDKGLIQNQNLENLMVGEFNSSSGNNVENPFTSGTGIKYTGPNYSKDDDRAITIVDCTSKSLSEIQIITFNESDAGIVVVQCYNDGYYIQGVEGNGDVVEERKYAIRDTYNTAYYYEPDKPTDPNPEVDKILSDNINAVFEALQRIIARGGHLKNNQLARAIEAELNGSVFNPVQPDDPNDPRWNDVDFVPNLKKVGGLSVVVGNDDSYKIGDGNDLKEKLSDYANIETRGMVVVMSSNNGYYVGGINADPKVLDNIKKLIVGNNNSDAPIFANTDKERIAVTNANPVIYCDTDSNINAPDSIKNITEKYNQLKSAIIDYSSIVEYEIESELSNSRKATYNAASLDDIIKIVNNLKNNSRATIRVSNLNISSSVNVTLGGSKRTVNLIVDNLNIDKQSTINIYGNFTVLGNMNGNAGLNLKAISTSSDTGDIYFGGNPNFNHPSTFNAADTIYFESANFNSTVNANAKRLIADGAVSMNSATTLNITNDIFAGGIVLNSNATGNITVTKGDLIIQNDFNKNSTLSLNVGGRICVGGGLTFNSPSTAISTGGGRTALILSGEGNGRR
jgi:prepilin-type N-terminal cleavage/methylation domain-containing protein